MGSIAATGLSYYHRTFGSELSRELFVRICDRLASDAVRTPEGLYLSMPGNETSMGYVAYSDLRESLGHAWELTGDEKYIRLGLQDIEEGMTSTIPNFGLSARPASTSLPTGRPVGTACCSPGTEGRTAAMARRSTRRA